MSRVSRTGVLNPSRVHLVHGSTGARGHVGGVVNHHGPHAFAHYCTLTRALTFSDTSGVRACLVREILRIESVAVAAQTLAVSDGVTRARIIMRMTRAVTGVEQPLDIVSRARLAESRRASLVWTKARAFSRGDTAVPSVFVANVDVPCKIGQLGVAVARAVS